MRTLQVHFPSGKEVLGRYWGMLRGGGLRLDLPMLPRPDADGWDDDEPGAPRPVAPRPAAPLASPDAVTVLPMDTQRGERLRLQVHVRTIKKVFPVLAQLMELTCLPSGLRAVVGFLPESPPDELLDAVWADGLNVPQRRTRRHLLRVPVGFACVSAGEVGLRPGELRNLSLGGCCIAGLALPRLGSQVIVQVSGEALARAGVSGQDTLHLAGRVRWTERPAAGLMGIQFHSASVALARLLQALPPAVRLFEPAELHPA